MEKEKEIDSAEYQVNQAKRIQNDEYNDTADFAARFAFSPRLERLGYEKDKYKHINKNLVLTHLSNKEVQQANRLLQAIQILTNYNKTTYYLILKNGEKKEIQGSIAQELQKEGYQVLAETTNRFQKVLDFKTGELFGMTSTASGAGASLLKQWNKQRLEQKQTIREEQEPDTFFGKTWSNANRTNNRRR